jgi:integrase
MAQRITEAVSTKLQQTVSDRDVFVFDTLCSGYALRRTPAGIVIHIAQARAGGRKMRISIGRWPAMRTAEARELARMAIADVREGRDPILERRARQQAAVAGGLSVAAFAEQWLACHGPKLRPKTVDDYQQHLRLHILPALGAKTVAGLAFGDLHELHARMKRIPRAANYALSILQAMLRHAVRIGLRSDNPCRDVARYPERKCERFLSPIERTQALNTIETMVRAGKLGAPAAAGLRLLIYTGARKSEIRAARWRDVDFDRRLIRLADSKTGARTIYLNDAAMDVLRSLPRDGAHVIGGHRLFLSKAWTRVREACGLDDVRTHDLRHSYASAALAAGVPLAMVGKLLGHKRASTTERYGHLAADDVVAAGDVVGVALVASLTTKANVVRLPRRRRR